MRRGATRIGDIGEFALIERLQRFLQPPSGSQIIKSIGDDCAVLQPAADADLIVTTDSQEEGVHYRLDWSTPEDIGWRCLAINVSDIAAMAGRPLGAVVALSLPADLDVAFVDGLYTGMQALAQDMACPIIGGNLTKTTGRISVTITVLGEVPRGTGGLSLRRAAGRRHLGDGNPGRRQSGAGSAAASGDRARYAGGARPGLLPPAATAFAGSLVFAPAGRAAQLARPQRRPLRRFAAYLRSERRGRAN